MYVLFASNVPLFITTIYDAQVKKFEVFHRNVLCMYVCMHVCAENENLTGRELVAFQNVVSRNIVILKIYLMIKQVIIK